MRRARTALVLAVPLFVTIACGQSDNGGDNMETARTYSLCPKTDESRQKLYEEVTNFAAQQNARLIDRGDGARRELSSMQSEVLNQTGGEPILLTVEKPDEFRISVTNLGLREKMALTIRSSGAGDEAGPVASFVDDLARFWVIQRVEGGVADDPPCA
jgi:hypothetical protein